MNFKKIKKKKKKNIFKYFVFILSLLVILIFITFFVFFLPPNNHGSTNITIKEGDSLDKIGKKLKNNNVIKSKPIFILYSRIKGDTNKFKAGNFVINMPIGLKDLNELLKKTPINQEIKVTIPEGYSIIQIAKLFDEKKLIEEKNFLNIAKNGSFNYDFLKFKKSKNMKFKLEGFLFPDTYYFDRNQKPKEMFCKMLDRFNEVIGEELIKISKKNNISILKLVTLASIVEKEAAIQEERAIIASVFYNRLKNNMKLESCSTVQYSLKRKDYKPIITIEDTKINDAYNTYKIKSLTPGPIASPGKESLKAVLYPKQTNYLFFVSNGDGSHHFSNTFEEHQNIIENNY